MRETVYPAHGRTVIITGTTTSPMWISEPSSNTCLLQATSTSLINWSWLDCHVRIFQEKNIPDAEL